MIGVAGTDQATCPKKTTLPASLSLTSPQPARCNSSIRFGAAIRRSSARDAGTVTAMIGKAGQCRAAQRAAAAPCTSRDIRCRPCSAFVAEVMKASGTSAQSAWGDLGVGLIGANGLSAPHTRAPARPGRRWTDRAVRDEPRRRVRRRGQLHRGRDVADRGDAPIVELGAGVGRAVERRGVRRQPADGAARCPKRTG